MMRTSIVVSGLTLFMILPGGGCTTSRVATLPPLPPAPPPYVQVPHPEGLDIGDLMLVFTHKEAPATDSLKDCDADFWALQAKTVAKDEIEQGAIEFVQTDPVKYHWCFYGKLMELEEKVRAEPYVDERQKLVLETYRFLTPIAKAFLEEYRESRYMRWAVIRYRQLSENVFYRRLELSAQAAMNMGTTVNPFGLLRAPDEVRGGVLEKYGLVRPEKPQETMATTPGPVAAGGPATAAPAAPAAVPPEPDRSPASSAASDPAPAAADDLLSAEDPFADLDAADTGPVPAAPTATLPASR